MTGDSRKRSLGLAAVLVLGTIAGFLVAAGTGGAEYATVDTIGSDSQAFQMPVEKEDQRVRFTLQADDGTAVEPVANFALYDPANDFFAEFELSGDGDDAEAILGESGPWVLFITERRNAQLAVQYEGYDDEDANVDLAEVPVTEERTVVAEQDGGALDEQVAFRLDQRPASVFLEYSGEIQDLDADVATDEGIAYELTDASVNTTEDGAQRSGDATLTSENLVAGTYEVSARADAFDGKLVFVEQTYQRDAVDADREKQTVEENVSTPIDEDEGTVVAEIQEGQAHEFATAGATNVTFVLPRDEAADLKIYNASDRFVKAVHLEADYESYGWNDHEDENESSAETNVTAKTVELDQTGDFVVYASYVSEEDVPVQTFVPVEDAPAATQLDVNTTEVALSGTEDSWNGTFEGGLLEAHAHTQDVAGMDRNVTVTGELGPVLHYEQAVNTFGIAVHNEHQVYPEHFTDGPLDVHMDASGVGGQTHLQFVHYER